MQSVDLPCQCAAIEVVFDDVIGRRQALRARGLRRHDRFYLRAEHAVALYDARDLDLFGAINHQHAGGAFGPLLRLDQQRHDENQIRTLRNCRSMRSRAADQRMEDRLQTLAL